MLPVQILLNNLLYDAMSALLPLDRVEREETRDEHQESFGNVEELPVLEIQRLRNQIEPDHAEHEPGGQTEHEMPAIPGALCHRATDEGHDERERCEQNRHEAIYASHRDERANDTPCGNPTPLGERALPAATS